MNVSSGTFTANEFSLKIKASFQRTLKCQEKQQMLTGTKCFKNSVCDGKELRYTSSLLS